MLEVLVGTASFKCRVTGAKVLTNASRAIKCMFKNVCVSFEPGSGEAILIFCPDAKKPKHVLTILEIINLGASFAFGKCLCL